MTRRKAKRGEPKDLLEAEVLPAPLKEEAASARTEPDEEESDETVLELEEGLEVLPADEGTSVQEEEEEEERILPPQAVSKTKELVRYDTFDAYLREISKYSPLSREEEHELAVRAHEHKDRDAIYRLVTSNLWLAVKIARDYERAARNIMDLVQEGNIGLLEAIKNFDPYKGVRFPSYAVWWIRAYIIRFVIANWRLVKIGTTQAQRKLFFNLRKEKERLEREGFSVGPRLIAQNLQVKESEVIEMEQRLGGGDVSVDAPLMNDHDSSLLTILPSQALTAEEIVSRNELQSLLKQSLEEFAATLNPKEKAILEERLLQEEKATLQEVAEKLSISRERVRQIENRIKEKLKDFLVEKLGPAVQNLMSIDGN